jgi:hypothetical protein
MKMIHGSSVRVKTLRIEGEMEELALPFTLSGLAQISVYLMPNA